MFTVAVNVKLHPDVFFVEKLFDFVNDAAPK
jgi:hypothetical protein